MRRYVSGVLDVVGPARDVFTPHKARDEEVMGWVMDTVSAHQRHTTNGVVTGKPRVMCGSLHNDDAVAQGLAVVLSLALARHGLGDLEGGARVIIQGAGSVGGHLARLLHAAGHRVIGLSDVHGGYLADDGLDVPALLAHRDATGSLRDAPGRLRQLPNEELLLEPCDVLVPCAVANVVTSRNAQDVRARLVIEGAHAPVSARAGPKRPPRFLRYWWLPISRHG